MSETTVDTVNDSATEGEIDSTSNNVGLFVGSALVGVAGTLAVRFVVKKIRARRPAETVHLVTDLEDKKSEEN